MTSGLSGLGKPAHDGWHVNGWLKVAVIVAGVAGAFTAVQTQVGNQAREIDRLRAEKASQEVVRQHAEELRRLEEKKANLELVRQQHEEIMRILREIREEIRQPSRGARGEDERS